MDSPIVTPLAAVGTSIKTVWERKVEVPCSCGGSVPTKARKCLNCRAKNGFAKLYKRRKHLKKWLEKQVDENFPDKLHENNRVLRCTEEFLARVVEVETRPIPKRSRREDVNLFARRVVRSCDTFLNQTSPGKLAHELKDQALRTALAQTNFAHSETHRFIREMLGFEISPLSGRPLEDQAREIQQSLLDSILPYIESLRTLNMYHSRLVDAYRAARPIIDRENLTSFSRSLRATFTSKTRLVKFGVAIWDTPSECDLIERFDAELVRFVEQIGRYRVQHESFTADMERFERTALLSLRNYLLDRLVAELSTTTPANREAAIVRILSTKGIGSFWYRLWHRRKNV